MSDEKLTATIEAGEDIEAGGIVRLGDDGLLYAGQRKTASTIEAADNIEVGDMVEINGDVPKSWKKILEKSLDGSKSELGKKLPSNRIKQYERPPSNPKHSQAVCAFTDQGYKYLGTNGDGYFYFTGLKGDGAFTLRPNGTLDKVGNKFSRQFLATLER